MEPLDRFNYMKDYPQELDTISSPYIPCHSVSDPIENHSDIFEKNMKENTTPTLIKHSTLTTRKNHYITERKYSTQTTYEDKSNSSNIK